MKNAVTIKIAHIGISFVCPNKGWERFLRKNYAYFLTSLPASFTVMIRPGPPPAQKTNTVRVMRDTHALSISGSDFYSRSHHTLNNTIVTVRKNKYSFDSWLRIYFTLIGVRRNGFLLHGAGTCLVGKKGSTSGTYLFLGKSGKGKSTITRILGKKHALSDELVFVFKKNTAFFASSTPFWGELKKGFAHTFVAPVKGMYFITHAKKLDPLPLRKGKALTELLKTLLFFSKDATLINKILSLTHEAVSSVPSYSLGFSLGTSRKQLISLLSTQKGTI